ncbi:hypothetical protein GW17_00030543 [Ensete ventricosum]|nr:hypothetical protein GW17_00030543 [Ensete ventricosum]RZS16868.1 hypothetical protein BHM03_00048935 [Ensete ventricosum]
MVECGETDRLFIEGGSGKLLVRGSKPSGPHVASRDLVQMQATHDCSSMVTPWQFEELCSCFGFHQKSSSSFLGVRITLITNSVGGFASLLMLWRLGCASLCL